MKSRRSEIVTDNFKFILLAGLKQDLHLFCSGDWPWKIHKDDHFFFFKILVRPRNCFPSLLSPAVIRIIAKAIWGRTGLFGLYLLSQVLLRKVNTGTLRQVLKQKPWGNTTHRHVQLSSLFNPWSFAQGWNCPQWTGPSHIHDESGK